MTPDFTSGSYPAALILSLIHLTLGLVVVAVWLLSLTTTPWIAARQASSTISTILYYLPEFAQIHVR